MKWHEGAIHKLRQVFFIQMTPVTICHTVINYSYAKIMSHIYYPFLDALSVIKALLT